MLQKGKRRGGKERGEKRKEGKGEEGGKGGEGREREKKSPPTVMYMRLGLESIDCLHSPPREGEDCYWDVCTIVPCIFFPYPMPTRLQMPLDWQQAPPNKPTQR